MKSKILLFTLASAIALLCGCSKEKEMPEDNQANHGPLAIMETENGYYYNYGYVPTGSDDLCEQRLRYWDKENGESILVCNKPECEHNGNDSCTATYKNITIINSLMYNDAIYVYGVEEDDIIIRFNLYRVAPDGSSIDKVGTVIESENTLNENVNISVSYNNDISAPAPFIIHKGYAYLPYYLRLGVASKGFMGGGLMQMDITTGETKTLYELEYMISKFPHGLTACGDYVYMNMINSHSTGETMRYVISEDRLEPISEKSFYDVFTDTMLYTVQASSLEGTESAGPISVNGYDVNTGELLSDKEFLTDIPSAPDAQIISFPYENMIVIGANDRVAFYGIGEENYGKKLGEMFFEPGYHEEILAFVQGLDFKINNDTLYRICTPINVKNYRPSEIRFPYFVPYEVYSCPVEDILDGNGQWTLEFTYAE